ncbi:uncharacterized protein [Porites lutea]|uniref:uncharacterized protein n=1 Tax=Porites lutea TaxID=51062 RepID=UPI003CC538BE
MKVSGTSVILLLFFTAVAALPSDRKQTHEVDKTVWVRSTAFGPKVPETQYPKPNVLMANPIKNKNANAGLEQYQQLPSNVEIKIKMVNDNVNAVIRNQQDLANFMSQMFEALFTNQGGLHQNLKYIINMVEQIPGNKV